MGKIIGNCLRVEHVFWRGGFSKINYCKMESVQWVLWGPMLQAGPSDITKGSTAASLRLFKHRPHQQKSKVLRLFERFQFIETQ
jgi:hypothetical protein